MKRLRRLLEKARLRSTRTLALALGMALGMAGPVMLPVARAQTYGEAPQLAERATAGDLPPVGERLPQNPLVVEPVERTGDYGGVWRSALVGGDDGAWLHYTIGYDTLLQADNEGNVIPNIAEGFEASEDATTFTLKLREGMKWSDGELFTADDIVFWFEDVMSNEALTPAFPSWLVVGGERATVEKVDDTTVIFSFAAPYGLFPLQLTRVIDRFPSPRHYLERFHERYNPQGIDALVEAEGGVNDWTVLFSLKADPWANPELPTLYPWKLTSAYGEGTQVVAERNPYYWKVDTEGNQLPYIDRQVFAQLEDEEVLLLQVLSGEIDLMARHFNTANNKALLTDNMQRGDYRLFDVVESEAVPMVLALNMTHPDPVKREIFQNKDFRIGLSHAINRPEIIDLIYFGQSEPYQPAVRPEAPFYNEQLAKQYTEYDVALANEHLDRAFPERDAQGFRLGPDGRRISFVLETFSRDRWSDIVELVRGYWREVGVDVQIREEDRSLFTERLQANQHDAVTYFGGAGLRDAIADMRWFFPNRWESAFAVAWANWYTGSPNSEEPPAAVKEQMALYEQLETTVDEAAQNALMEQILEIAAEAFYAMSINLKPPSYGVVKNSFGNVPETMYSYFIGTVGPLSSARPEQFFIEGGGAR